MGLPKVNITLGNGAIGAVTKNDGVAGLIVSGVAVSGKFALGDILGPFLSADDAIAKGITSAYDTTNTTVAYQHIKEFFDEAGVGNKLYVMVVAKTVKLSDAADKTQSFAKKLLSLNNGAICLLGICRTPQSGYTPTYVDQFDTDLWVAVANAQALYVDEYANGRPVQIFLEGRDFQGTAGTAKNLRDAAGLNCNRVSVVIHQDNTYAAANGFAAKYASVGSALGRAAEIHVGRNIGRVQDGAIAIANPGLSNGAANSAFSDVNLGGLHDYGYIFARKYATKGGYYFNGDPVAAPITDDYNSISRGRAIDKVVRITNGVYTNFINDDIELDSATGRMNPAIAKGLQDAVENEVQLQMMSGVKEISGIKATVDVTQNVLTTNKTTVGIKVVPKGSLQVIDVNLSYAQSI
jgi:hypothetical protein